MAGLCEGGIEPSGSLKAICKEKAESHDLAGLKVIEISPATSKSRYKPHHHLQPAHFSPLITLISHHPDFDSRLVRLNTTISSAPPLESFLIITPPTSCSHLVTSLPFPLPTSTTRRRAKRPGVRRTTEYTPTLPEAPSNPPAPSTSVSAPGSGSSRSFHDLLPTSTKARKTSARGRSRQIACLLTSPENIAQMKKKKNVQRESEDMIEIDDSDDDDDDDEEEEDEDVVVEIDNEGSDDICQFCMLKYSDPKSVKKGEWIQCQRKGEWYHE
ncbi:hypothetical protein ANN_08967, partial [Periplaneta americana]